jgi:hypothetical protein
MTRNANSISEETFGISISVGPFCISFDRRESDDIIREVRVELHENGRKEIGKIGGVIVPYSYAGSLVDMLSIADDYGDEYEDLVSKVVGDRLGLAEELDLEPGNIFCLNQIQIVPEYRGYQIGLAAIWHLLDIMADGCAVVVMKPHLILGDPEFDDNYNLPKMGSLSDGELDAAQKKIAAYWTKVGFKPIPSHPDYLYFNPAHKLCERPEII